MSPDPNTSRAARPASEVATALDGDPVLWLIGDSDSGALLELGKRRLHPRANPEPGYDPEQREYEGERSLFIQCHWARGVGDICFFS